MPNNIKTVIADVICLKSAFDGKSEAEDQHAISVKIENLYHTLFLSIQQHSHRHIDQSRDCR